MYRFAKLLIVALVAWSHAPLVPAQRWAPPSPEQRRAAYARKLAKPFATKLPWLRTIDEATVAIRRAKRFGIAYVTPCYCACPVSEALEDGPLVSEWWLRRARDFPLYLNIEARLPDLPDQRFLSTQDGYYSFPWFFFIDEWGQGVAAVDVRSEAAFDESLALATLTAAQMQRVARTSGGAAAKAGLTLCRAFFKRTDHDLDVYDALAATPGLDPAVKALYARRRGELVQAGHVHAINDVLREFARSPLPPAQVTEQRMAKIYAMWKDGIRIPPGGTSSFLYCEVLVYGAVRAGDLDTARAYYAAAKARSARMQAFFGGLMAHYPPVFEHAFRSANTFKTKLFALEHFLRERGVIE